MSDQKLIRFVTRHLDASADRVTREQSERLFSARQNALRVYDQRSHTRLAGLAGVFHLDIFARRALINACAALMVALGAAYWHATQYVGELAELDSAILTDEMPIDVITDKGFDAWLKSASVD